MKKLFILVDGIADLGTPETNFKTPLQMANIPHIDAIAQSGISGMMDPVEPGLSCGSDTAHMSIFGYDPFTLYRGRGSFETIGSGIDMDIGDIAFKCNFAHLGENNIIKLRRVDREFPEWGLPLIEALKEMEFDHKIVVKHATEHRIGLKVCGEGLSDKVTGTDPLKDNLKLREAKAKVNTEAAIKSADLINRLSNKIRETLAVHPINLKRREQGLPTADIVLLRGCGQKLDVTPFNQKYNLKGAIIAPTAIIKGFGKTIGLQSFEVEGATGDYNTNLLNKGIKALELLGTEIDFIFLHIKAVDDAGHDKSLKKKIEYLEKVDEMVAMIYEKQKEDIVICLTGDHTTPWSYGDHTFQPVPVSMSKLSWIKNNKKSIVKAYNEIDCLKGELGRFCGKQFMPTLIEFAKQQ